MAPSPAVTLRRTGPADVELLYAIGLDELANRLAGTKPRAWSEFSARWADIVTDLDGSRTGVTSRVVLADGVAVGSINVFPDEGHTAIGYWLAREHWGRGIASAALSLMLVEHPGRPLRATTSAQNHASMKVLRKSGFVEVARALTPETARAHARETVTFVLR